ncbi:MAG TPA: DUF3795 domain-containing protein [Candidatus Eisenbergiella merdipullorum]|uniref:DUF3795 domain-containing protein n=1 Tax=Candidatus Eisenbergiella merdipullorum TaxID=2838553 RepID=A0A9D2L1P0_9FIRM|nr:DUF3795 domain-containing protein [Candidatus Eisenbergiella merdipullorum]
MISLYIGIQPKVKWIRRASCRTKGTLNGPVRKQPPKFYKEIFGLDIPLEKFHCEGGRSDSRFELCGDCPFVKCCKEHHVFSCGECPEYPCKEISDYQIKYLI